MAFVRCYCESWFFICFIWVLLETGNKKIWVAIFWDRLGYFSTHWKKGPLFIQYAILAASLQRRGVIVALRLRFCIFSPIYPTSRHHKSDAFRSPHWPPGRYVSRLCHCNAAKQSLRDVQYGICIVFYVWIASSSVFSFA